MCPSTQLTGIHSRSERLIELTRSYDRGKTSWAEVEKQFDEDTREIVELQEDLGFENFSDGALGWQDQLRPIAETLKGVVAGTRYSRWFDTNTFYQKPIVTGKIALGNFQLKNFIRADLLPKTKSWKVSLVGPYTFSELSENRHYNNQSDLIFDLAQAEHEIINQINARGVSSFQLSEPCLVYQPYRERPANEAELGLALSAIGKTVEDVPAAFSVQTFFGDASPILPRLLELPVETVGFDVFETNYSQLQVETSKKLSLGIVDSRDSNVEEPAWIAETAKRVTKHIAPSDLIFVSNSDLKFVPRQVADAKAQALAKATGLYLEEG